MANLILPWDNSKSTYQTSEQSAARNPLIPYIKTQLTRGIPRSVIFENLMKNGYPYRNIKTALSLIDRMNNSKLDWRSPTSINETARMIRRDVRAKKVSYSVGMRILIKARDNLKSLTLNQKDRRLGQLNKEIRVTKKLLMSQYGDPLMLQQYRIVGGRMQAIA